MPSSVPRKLRSFNENGGGASGKEVGLIFKTGADSDFAIFLSYDKQGYVEDKDSDKIDSDAILNNMKEGTEQSNERRKANGIPAMHVTGWEEKPAYDKGRHVVIWAIGASVDGNAPIVNYNTRILGREGVLSVNLATDTSKLAQFKPESEKIQSAIDFKQGKRYADFKPGDKVSAGGIAALILGGVLLKKAGILAFLGAFLKPMLLAGGKLLAAGGKLIAIACAAVVGSFKKLFGRNKNQS